MMKMATVLTLFICVCLSARAQNPSSINTAEYNSMIREVSVTPISARLHDTVPNQHRLDWSIPEYRKPFPVQKFLLPTALVAYGFAGLHVSGLQHLNKTVKDEIYDDRPHAPLHLDNYLMFVPAAAVYGLNAAGIKGKHNFKDRTILLLMSQLFTNSAVFALKGQTRVLRPDGSAYNSFPSGHTAVAFANAEFMRLEYKDVSPWYGVAGYAAATATGVLRMYNNKHWLNDVVAGAGFGIAGTRLAYWLYPKLQHSLFKGSPGTVLMPSYQSGSYGLSFAKSLSKEKPALYDTGL
ncbi:MAG: phosphatase PAP2 family protein [Chitinophagaceae bacterium]|nr:phosphatase PAP2 family protein [Chitinophagaceae bacterium]